MGKKIPRETASLIHSRCCMHLKSSGGNSEGTSVNESFSHTSVQILSTAGPAHF